MANRGCRVEDDTNPTTPTTSGDVPDPTMIETLSERIQHLERALQTRGVIGQAIGILMAHHRCDANAAFDRLVTASQASNRKLYLVAADLVAAEPATRALPVHEETRRQEPTTG